ncbi:MAG: methanogenesis marker 8 protein [Candidatus Helarchaeota archaeon]
MGKKEDRHVWEIAKAKVVVSNQKVIKVENDPLIKYCPLHEMMLGTKYHTKETIKKHMENKIKSVTHLCSPNRILVAKIDGVGYGASETFSTAVKYDIIDAVVEPCDGAGTIISDNPDVVQGIGIAMNALISTTPIPEVLSKLKELGAIILDPENATIDQIAGVKKAFELGYERVGVTIAAHNAKMILKIRDLEKKYKKQAIVGGMHTTGITEDVVPYILQLDFSQSCSSKVMRDIVAKKARKIYGKTIPVYAFSKIGQKILDLRQEISRKNPPALVVGKVNPPNPLI